MNTILSILLTILATFNSHCKDSKRDSSTLKAQSISTLDDKVVETSGLIYFDNSFWTINDSGNSNTLYRMDAKTGSVITEITIKNSKNIDWEELTQDEHYIYIADIGDNSHKRDEKQIYRLKKSEVLKVKKSGSVDSDVIRFKYPEIDGKKNNFNAEALISFNGVLHLFTKDFFETNHFTLSPEPGKTTARFIEKFKSNGQVTGAAINSLNNTLIMVGYLGMGERLVWEIKGFNETCFFNDLPLSFSLGPLNVTGQVESVCFNSKGEVFFTNENTWNVKQQLWNLQNLNN